MVTRKITLDELRHQQFPSDDVLTTFNERYNREHKLRSAMALTHGDHEPIWILVALATGETAEVYSNLIDLEDNYVELHGGLGIPLTAIYDVGV